VAEYPEGLTAALRGAFADGAAAGIKAALSPSPGAGAKLLIEHRDRDVAARLIGIFLPWWASGLAALPSDRDSLITPGALAAIIGPFAWWAGR
jgi:hypothetical protein